MPDTNNKVICPDCGAEIKSQTRLVGDILECSECGTEVEILSINPLKYRELIEEKWSSLRGVKFFMTTKQSCWNWYGQIFFK